MKLAAHEFLTMYMNLIKASGQEDECPHIQIVNDATVNAYTTKDGIFVYQGIIDVLNNIDELALVVGHELSHYLLGHVTRKALSTVGLTRRQEMQADKYGAILMMLAGYDLCKGRNMLIVLLDLYGDVMDADHPDNAYRYAQLQLPSCGGPI